MSLKFSTHFTSITCTSKIRSLEHKKLNTHCQNKAPVVLERRSRQKNWVGQHPMGRIPCVSVFYIVYYSKVAGRFFCNKCYGCAPIPTDLHVTFAVQPNQSLAMAEGGGIYAYFHRLCCKQWHCCMGRQILHGWHRGVWSQFGPGGFKPFRPNVRSTAQ